MTAEIIPKEPGQVMLPREIAINNSVHTVVGGRKQSILI